MSKPSKAHLIFDFQRIFSNTLWGAPCHATIQNDRFYLICTEDGYYGWYNLSSILVRKVNRGESSWNRFWQTGVFSFDGPFQDANSVRITGDTVFVSYTRWPRDTDARPDPDLKIAFGHDLYHGNYILYSYFAIANRRHGLVIKLTQRRYLTAWMTRNLWATKEDESIEKRIIMTSMQSSSSPIAGRFDYLVSIHLPNFLAVLSQASAQGTFSPREDGGNNINSKKLGQWLLVEAQTGIRVGMDRKANVSFSEKHLNHILL